MTWVCYCQGPELYSHPELVAAWITSVPHLPRDGIRAFHLDVTPAPAAKRHAHPLILNAFVSDKRCAKTFLSCHVDDVAALVRAVNAHYAGTVNIYLTGTLSRKSAFFPQAVQKAAGYGVPFIGTWVERREVRFASIAKVACQIGPKKSARKTVGKGQPYKFKNLRKTVWSKDTKWTFALVVYNGDEKAATCDLRMIAEFEADGGREVLEMQAVNALGRALQHKISKDLGLRTMAEGDGPERHVVVRKK